VDGVIEPADADGAVDDVDGVVVPVDVDGVIAPDDDEVSPLPVEPDVVPDGAAVLDEPPASPRFAGMRFEGAFASEVARLVSACVPLALPAADVAVSCDEYAAGGVLAVSPEFVLDCAAANPLAAPRAAAMAVARILREKLMRAP